MSLKNKYYYILIAAVSLLLFLPGLGSAPLFDWDEVNFAEASREMIETGDYLTVRIDYRPFHEKPPLFFIAQSLSMNIFGVNEFAARFPNAIIGAITLIILFSTGTKMFGRKFGLLWALAYLGSILPHFYFRTGIIDPMFNLFIFLGVYFLADYYYFKHIFKGSLRCPARPLILSAAYCGLAMLTKGPVAYLLILLTWAAYWAFNLKKIKIRFAEVFSFTLVAFLPSVLWYLALALTNADFDIVSNFLDYHLRLLSTSDAGHSGPLYYHFLVVLIGCFPASIFLFGSLRKNEEDSYYQANFKVMAVIMLCVVLVVFSIVRTKILHYSSLAYFPVTFLGAYYLFGVMENRLAMKNLLIIPLALIGLVYAAAFGGIPYILANSNEILPHISDQLTREILSAPVHWGGWEFITGAVYFIALSISVFLLIKNRMLAGSGILFFSNIAAVTVFLAIVTPKIGEYLQGGLIDFYKGLSGKEVYVEVVGHKSYAHYFYAKRPESLSAFAKNMSKEEFRDWLLEGNIDKPAYFVSKSTKADKFLKQYNLKLIRKEYGFAYMKRLPE